MKMHRQFEISAFRNMVTLLLLFFSSSIFAKHFKVLDISNGLSNNTVKCITQDKQGFIWLGTFDGLCRFDGVDFTIFRHNPDDSLSIVSNHVETVLSVDSGLWVGTQDGLDFYSYEDNCFYPSMRILSNGEKQRMKKAVKNIIKIGNRIFVLNAQRELLVLTDENLAFKPYDCNINAPFLAITPYKKDFLLVQTPKNLCIINPDEAKIVSQINLIEKESSDNILYYSSINDIVYVGYGIGYESIAFRINKNMAFESLDAPVPSDLKAVVDYDGKTYFGTDGRGLISMSGNEQNRYLPANSNISSDAIHSLYVDNDNNLWLGTYRGGLNLCSTHFSWFNALTVADQQLTQGVVTAVLSQKDLLYIGQDGGGLNIYDKNSGRTTAYTTANSNIAGNHILSLSGDGQYVWMGVYGKGLCRFTPSTRTFKTFSLPDVAGKLNPNRIWEIKNDSLGRIWIIGEDVWLFDKATEVFSAVSELNGTGASGICFDGNSVWVGTTTSGLYKLNRMTGKVMKHYFKGSQDLPIEGNYIRYIYMDSQHQLWFSTEYSGLFKLDDTSGKITHYHTKHGLTDRSVVSIQEDGSGFYWLGTSNGLFRYDSRSNTFVRFGKEDNLPFVQFNYNACYAQDNVLYYGAVGGLVWFKPEDIKYNQYSDKVYFTGVELLNREKKTIYLHGETPNEIRLSHDQNFFTISFSTPELISPDKVYFSCYMENFEQGWQEIAHNREVSYTNVPPGKYLFYVKSSDNSGKWSKNISCLKIIITPPWWQTSWAMILWCILVLGILFAIFCFYQHELNIKHMVALNEIEKNAVKSISEAKLNFFTNITHELRTPIFLITAPLEELMASKNSSVQVPRSYLMAMYRNAIRLNKLISRIIDFRKLESGKLKLKLQRQNVVSFCKDLTVDYEALCLQKNILFYFQPSKTVVTLDFDPDKLELILSNLVSNAFKYTPEGGHIVFSIDEVGDSVVFTVEDNGIGIKKEYHEAIFDSFFQIDPSKASASGDGIGLSFVKHLVELHRGVVKVESTPEQGSKFIFCLPKPDMEEEEQDSATSFAVVLDEEIKKQPLAQDVVSTHSPAAVHSILIIDDEKETVEILERFLIEDFKVLKANNGLDGLTIAQTSLPDIIICDIMMPKMDGAEFLSIVKGDKKLSHIPVIMFTAKTSEEDKMAAFDSGADAYLTKPISLKYLRKRIDHLLARSESVEMTNIISKTEKKYTKEEQRFLLKCKEIIDDNLTNADFDVCFLAEQLGMSHSSLYRKIKSVSGMSVIEFVNEYRIFKAVQYFKEGETNISAVSVKCGFNDLKNFRDAFKKKMNVSPKQYVLQL